MTGWDLCSFVCDHGISQLCASMVLLVSSLFSDLSCFRSSPGMKRSWETLVIVPELVVLLLRFPCACLDLCPPSCSCPEQLMGRKAALQLHCSTLGPHCHLSTRSSVVKLGLVILIIQPINWAWLS